MLEELKGVLKRAIEAYDKKNPNNTVDNTVRALEEVSIELQESFVKMMKEQGRM